MAEAGKLVNAADTLQTRGKASEAIALYQQALRLQPGRVDAQNNLGNALLTQGQYEAAANCYHAALEIRPHDARILCNLANAQRRLGLLNAAIASGRVITASQWQVRQRIHATSIGRWRHFAQFVQPLQSLVDTNRVRHGAAEPQLSALPPAAIVHPQLI